jgi:hypothetical protein
LVVSVCAAEIERIVADDSRGAALASNDYQIGSRSSAQEEANRAYQRCADTAYEIASLRLSSSDELVSLVPALMSLEKKY